MLSPCPCCLFIMTTKHTTHTWPVSRVIYATVLHTLITSLAFQWKIQDNFLLIWTFPCHVKYVWTKRGYHISVNKQIQRICYIFWWLLLHEKQSTMSIVVLFSICICYVRANFRIGDTALVSCRATDEDTTEVSNCSLM